MQSELRSSVDVTTRKATRESMLVRLIAIADELKAAGREHDAAAALAGVLALHLDLQRLPGNA